MSTNSRLTFQQFTEARASRSQRISKIDAVNLLVSPLFAPSVKQFNMLVRELGVKLEDSIYNDTVGIVRAGLDRGPFVYLDPTTQDREGAYTSGGIGIFSYLWDDENPVLNKLHPNRPLRRRSVIGAIGRPNVAQSVTDTYGDTIYYVIPEVNARCSMLPSEDIFNVMLQLSGGGEKYNVATFNKFMKNMVSRQIQKPNPSWIDVRAALEGWTLADVHEFQTILGLIEERPDHNVDPFYDIGWDVLDADDSHERVACKWIHSLGAFLGVSGLTAKTRKDLQSKFPTIGTQKKFKGLLRINDSVLHQLLTSVLHLWKQPYFQKSPMGLATSSSLVDNGLGRRKKIVPSLGKPLNTRIMDHLYQAAATAYEHNVTTVSYAEALESTSSSKTREIWTNAPCVLVRMNAAELLTTL